MRHVISVTVPRPYILDLTFDDGTQRQVDMEGELWGPMFEPLRDPALFRQASVDPDLETVVWPNGADVSPEYLYYGDQNPYEAFLDEVAKPAATSTSSS